MNLNILLRGQSNAIILGQVAGANAVAAEVQKLLGFDGITDTVTLLFKENDGSGSSTAASGTALIGDWLTPTTVNGQASWTPNTYEQGIINYANALSPAAKADPTVVLWLHNEYDSADQTLTAGTWTSAVRYDAALLRTALASPVTYVFVEPIPLNAAADAGAQAIREGMEQLVADSSFNARLTASTDDLAMDGVFRGAPGHMDDADAALVADRAARSIAEVFASFAKPGSALATGNIDDTGPIAVQAQQTTARAVSVSLQFDGATALKALDADAATGIGWKAIAGATVLDATGVALGAGNSLIVSFGADLPAGARLYYGYGDSHLLRTSGDASGNAIYDDQDMPLRSPAIGLLIGAPAVQPGTTQAGTDAGETIVAGPNGDTIIGGKGDDFLVGGAGADTFAVSLGDGNDWVDGFTPGQDHIKFGAGITASDVLVTPLNISGVDGLGVIYGAGGDGIFLAGVTALPAGDFLYSAPPVLPPAVQTGTAADDTLVAGASGDTLIGGKGNDFLVGGAGADEIVASRGDGLDWVDGFTPGKDHIKFGPGITAEDWRTELLTLSGVNGLEVYYNGGADGLFLAGVTALQAGDVIYSPVVVEPPTLRTGTAVDDTLVAGGSGDTLIGGAGNDYLIGGAGADVFGFKPGDGPDWVDDFTPGSDHLLFGGGLAAADISVSAGDFVEVSGLFVRYGEAVQEIVFLAGVTALQTGDLTFGPLPVPAQSGPPVITSASTASFAENATGTVYTVTGADPDAGTSLSYALTGVDAALFTINAGTGVVTFKTTPNFEAPADAGANNVYDVNVVASDGTLTGSKALAITVTNVDELPAHTAPRDFDGSGGSDILWRGAGNEVAIWRMDGSQLVGSESTANPGSYWSIAGTGDFNGDGKADILWRGQGAEVAIWEMDGSQTIGGGLTANPGSYWSIAGTGDFNGDGKADILWRGQGAEVAIWEMDGSQTIGGGLTANPGSYWTIAGSGDFNGDGKADILWRGQGAEVAIWEMDGSQTIGGGLTANPGSYWSIAGTGDFNGDGKADILWRGQGAEVAIWEMDGSQTIGGGLTANPGSYWSIAGTGDLNGDGKADILWRGQGAEVAIWEMDGAQMIGSGLAPNPSGYWTIAG